MRTRRRPFGGALLFGLGIALFPSATYLGARPQFRCESRAGVLAEDRWTMVVETATVTTAVGAHGSDVANIRYYAVVVDLRGGGNPVDRARVVGPLWTKPEGRFDRERRRGGSEPAIVAYFDERGALNWLRDGKRKMLDLNEQPVRWSDAGKVIPIPAGSDTDPDARLTYAMPRKVLASGPAGVAVHDVGSGERTDDPWLQGAFATLDGIRGLAGSSIALTDDGDHLVCWPSSWLNPGDNSAMITSFTVEGLSYLRSRYAVYCSRPNGKLAVFRKAVPTTEGSDDYLGAIVVESELLLVLRRNDKAMLITTDGDIRFEIDGQPLAGLLRHEPKRGRLHFISGGGNSVGSWDYRAGKIARHELDVRSLFRARWGRLEPLQGEHVRH